jgi:hypothetical protein
MRFILTGVVLCCSVWQLVLAQKAPAKFGDLNIEDLQMTVYDQDSSAAAVVLVDYGESFMKYHPDRGFTLVFERLRRVKVLRSEGLELANPTILTYKSAGRGQEKILSLKAITYNLENGKAVPSKMKSDGEYREPYDKNWDVTKFTFPNVKVGSILECSYVVESDFFFNLKDWEFQSTIPTRWSEYRVRIPEWFKYERYMQGYVPLHLSEKEMVGTSLMFTYKERDDAGVPISTETRSVDHLEERSRWVARDVPAFRNEPFLTSASDYLIKINFELASTRFPNSPITNYMGSWDEINRTFFENSDFGGEVKGNGYLKKEVDGVIANLTTPEQKLEALTRLLKGKVSWDGRSRNFSRSILKKVWEEGKGNSAEINLLLCALLEKAGFDVSPVLCSTRDHGFIREMFPNSQQFNYVLCLVQYNNTELLVDATEPLLPFNTLPEHCLNGRGLVISKNAPRWVNLIAGPKTRVVTRARMTLDDEGKLTGDLDIERSGYAALARRKLYAGKGESGYMNDLVSTKDWSVSTSKFENIKDVDKTLKENHHVEIRDNVTLAGQVMYINPFVLMQTNSNPFKSEKREYPVDFAFAKDEMYFMTITIPDGYAVEELPKSKVILLPENGSKYTYNITHNGNQITVTSVFAINKSIFTQVEYPHVREYYNQIVAKQAEQIVLKKKT